MLVTRHPLCTDLATPDWCCKGFCHRRPITRGCVLSSFRHGTNHKALAARMSRNTLCWTNTEGDPLISRETSLVRMSTSWFLVSTYLIWILGFQVDPVKQPIKSDSVSARHMSHRGTSSFNYHLDHGFVVFKDVQLRFSLRRTCVGGYTIHLAQLINPLFSIDMLGLAFGITNCRVEHPQVSLS